MISTAFETVTRRAAQSISRRGSLLTLGAAALAATMANADISAAKKKKKGGKSEDKEKKRCKNDAAACKDNINPHCDPNDPATCFILRNCCEECSANGFLECLILASAER